MGLEESRLQQLVRQPIGIGKGTHQNIAIESDPHGIGV